MSFFWRQVHSMRFISFVCVGHGRVLTENTHSNQRGRFLCRSEMVGFIFRASKNGAQRNANEKIANAKSLKLFHNLNIKSGRRAAAAAVLGNGWIHFGPRRIVFAFLADDSFFTSDLRLLFGVAGVVDSTLKNPSRRPCVDEVRVFCIFLQPPRMRSSLN